MPNKNEAKLLGLKAEIDEAKTKRAEYTGQLNQLNGDLKEKYDCDTPKQAEKKLVEMKEEIADLGGQITEGVEKLEEDYEL